jgi:hypothetical protein
MMTKAEVLTLDEGLAQHLTEALTLRIDLIIIPACKQAIEAYNRGDQDALIDLPEGWVFTRFGEIEGRKQVEAYNLIQNLRLYKFLIPPYIMNGGAK